MITAGTDRNGAVLLGTTRDLEQAAEQIEHAVLRGTAHGIYEARVNGQPATDSVLNPGWTAYEWRLRVQSFDVTAILRGADGQVHVEVLLGNGWYRGELGFGGAKANYGDETGFVGELVITYANGATQRCAQTKPGPVEYRTARATACTTARPSMPDSGVRTRIDSRCAQ